MGAREDLRNVADAGLATNYARFFKTGKGEYGEGDKFLGMRVGTVRSIAKKHKNISLKEIESLLYGEYHEERLCALFIMVEQYEKYPKKIVSLYLNNREKVNNWDLVDSSAHKILGRYVQDKSRNTLYKLANSKSLWDKRISIISCFWFIKDNDFEDALKLSEILLDDDHDLIHKAVGWVLREVGKKDVKVLEKFLKKHYKNMPRTMLRYSIEKFEETKRKKYLQGKI